MILEGAINQHGPIVRVRLRGPDGYEIEGDALIDTGAGRTIVDAAAARRLRVPVTGTRRTQSACGQCDMPEIQVEMRVAQMPWAMRQLYAQPGLDKGQLVACLGWDFLGMGRLQTDGKKRRWRFVID